MLQSRSEEVKKLKHNVVEKINTPRVRGQKCSIDNIPAALPVNKYNYEKMLAKEFIEEKKIIDEEVPINSICNSYRFLVNYG